MVLDITFFISSTSLKKWYYVRDLSLMGRLVLLKVNRRQFKCTTCGKPFSEELDFVGKHRKHTDRFAEMIVQQVIHTESGCSRSVIITEKISDK